MPYSKYALPCAADATDHINADLVAETDSGFIRMKTNETPLGKVIDQIANSENPGDSQYHLRSNHSDSSFLTMVADYKNAVKTEAAGNGSLSPELFEWFGMTAAYLLRDFYGLKIKEDSILLGQLRNDGGNLLASLTQEALLKAVNWPENSNGDIKLTVLRLVTAQNPDGEPFAVLDPHIGLCPMNVYSDSLFFESPIPWFDRQKPDNFNGWRNPAVVWEELQKLKHSDGVPSDEACVLRDLLRELLQTGSPDLPLFQDAVRLLLRELDRVTSNLATKNTLFLPLRNMPGLARLEVNMKGVSIAPAQFSEKLLVFPMEQETFCKSREVLEDGRCIWPLRKEDETKPEFLCCVTPLKQEFYDLLDDCSLDVVFSNITCGVDYGCECTVFYEQLGPKPAQGNAPKMRLRVRKEYTKGAIILAAGLPYLSLWPNVSFSPAEAWQLYYLVQFQPEECNPDMLQREIKAVFGCVEAQQPSYDSMAENAKKIRLFVTDAISYSDGQTPKPDGDKLEHSLHKHLDPRIQLQGQIYYLQRRPSCMQLQCNNLDCGTLQLRRLAATTLNQVENRRVALDYGTTSTICRTGEILGELRSIKSPRHYVLDIVPASQDRREVIGRYYWVEPQKDNALLGKISTTAMCSKSAQANPNDDELPCFPFLGGRHLTLDGIVWSVLRGVEDPETAGVYLNLKFKNTGNILTTKMARKIFFSYVLTLAALDLRSSGMNKAELFVSYPNQTARENMNEPLVTALQKVQRWTKIASPGEECSVSAFTLDEERQEVFSRLETSAAVCYFKKEGNEQTGYAPNPTQGEVIVDIGGGTADISMIYGEDLRPLQESLRFAGDPLIRQSIILALDLDYTADGGFSETNLKRIFPKTLHGIDRVYNEYIITYKEQWEKLRKSSASAFSIPGNAAAYETIAEVVESIMREPMMSTKYDNVTDSMTCQPAGTARALVALSESIRLRYLLLFAFVAYHLKNAQTQKAQLSAKGFASDFEDFAPDIEIKVCLAGFGARGLGFCAGQALNQVKPGNNAFFRLAQRLMQEILGGKRKVLFIPPTGTEAANEKVEVVNGLMYMKPAGKDENGNIRKDDAGNIVEPAEYAKDQEFVQDDGGRRNVRNTAEVYEAYQKVREDFIAVFDKVLSEESAAGAVGERTMMRRMKTVWDTVAERFKNGNKDDHLTECDELHAVTRLENRLAAAAVLACNKAINMSLPNWP